MKEHKVKGEDEKRKGSSLKSWNAGWDKTSLKGRLRSKQRCRGKTWVVLEHASREEWFLNEDIS